MKQYLRSGAAAAVLLLGVTACDNSVLNVTPKDQLSDQVVFSDPNLAETFLNDIYRGMGHGIYEIMLSSMTDESHFIHNYNTEKVVQSIISPSDRGAVDDGRFNHFDWSDNYSRIRQANTFLQGLEGSEFDAAMKQRMEGEVRFLRAYFYHNLLRMYGGVPIIDKVYSLNDEFGVARNTFQETLDFVVSEATAAAELLPVAHGGSGVGRATKGAALSLKARVLLYAASDLYVENPSGMAETGYTGSVDRTARWRAAKDAAKEVMDLGIYELYGPNPAPEDAWENYANIFLQKNSSETILNRYFLVTKTDGSDPGQHNGPNGYHTWGGNTPIQNLVDDYRMADGSEFDWSNPVHAAAPYENRDPRFYGSILYDGAKWRERPTDVRALDPYGIIQTFRELRLPDGTVQGGLDTRDSPIEDWNGGYSGYLLRKFIDPNVNAQFENQEVPWPFFRYAEVLLNYAEASIELNELGDAVEQLNRIRRRAGMPEFSAALSQAALREEYRNERRVEMAFEEQRFFDVRRWMIAPEQMAEDAGGINIFLDGTDPIDRSTWTNYEYETRVIQTRGWNDALYFMPIHRDEINRNDMLVQNPGY
jgi:hypothetical protein